MIETQPTLDFSVAPKRESRGKRKRDLLLAVLKTGRKWSKGEIWTELVLSITTTNGYILAHAEIRFEGKDFSVLLPKKTVSVCREFFSEKTSLTVAENNLIAKTATRTLIARLSASKFPNWELFMPTDELRSIDLPSGLSSALKRSVLSTDRFGYVRQVFGDGSLVIKAKGSEEGEAEERLPCPSVNGDGFELGLNALHLLEVLRNTGEAKIEVSRDAGKPYLVRPQVARSYDLFYCLVPVRLDRI
jgi:DNA polymerase III sliding clamp (beta) subunit (PCNA family)